MKERPILFSAPMVRAILAGQKSQTRRAVKPQPKNDPTKHHAIRPFRTPAGGWNWVLDATGMGTGDAFPCPFGVIGDRLWVREAWQSHIGPYGESLLYAYRATDDDRLGPWKPSIHMPREACRLVLEISDVRVERLHDISESDAIAEGVESPDSSREDHDWSICSQCGGTRLYTSLGPNLGACPDTDCFECDTHAKRFRHLWTSINKDASWDANPWVWVIEFKRVTS